MGQTSKDIDIILEDIKKRRQEKPNSVVKQTADDIASQIIHKHAQTSNPVSTSSVHASTFVNTNAKPAGLAVQTVPEAKADDLGKINTKKTLQHKDQQAIAEFINSPVEDDILPREILIQPSDTAANPQESSSQIVDDRFREFFTQTVAVTKPPEETNIEIKRKRNSFFKKKYITDSLSLHIPKQETTAEKPKNISIEKSETPKSAISTDSIPSLSHTTAKNDMVNSIYHAIAKKHEEETLAPEEMTGMIDNLSADKTVISVQHGIVEQPDYPQEPVFEEYISNSEFLHKLDHNSSNIAQELRDFRSTLTIRMILGFSACAILMYFNLAATFNLPLPGFMHPQAQTLLFYFISLTVYSIALIGFLPTIVSGFAGLKGSATPDSMLSLACVLGFVQLVLLVATSNKIDTSTTTVFAGFITLTLAFNAIGKRINANTILKNLSLAEIPDGINAGYIIKDQEVVRRLARTLEEKTPYILTSRKTGNISDVVQAGFSTHKSDYIARKTAFGSMIVTALCFVLGSVISKSLLTGLLCATGAAALQIPLSHTLVSSLPSAFMQKSLKKVGALVNGWQGIDQLSKTTHVTFDAKHLFPKGTVILHGIKTFEKERLDLAIIYAASVLIEKCESLKPIFMEVLEGKTDMLYPVESCEYTQGQGYVAWVHNSRVIIGNRFLMEQYEIAMPPLSLETGFIKQGRKPIYLSVNGKLFGMFVVSYTSDPQVKENLDKLVEKGVNIILSSTDFNIDHTMVEAIYEIPADIVQVLNTKESSLLSPFTQYESESTACLAHLDSLHSLVAGFCGAESARTAESVCSLVQTLSVIIGAVLALVFTYAQTLAHLPLHSIVLLSLGWMGLSVMAAFTKKY